jgi:hypothetical protein
MSERIKSLSEKKIEKSLGISSNVNDLSDLDSGSIESSPSEDALDKIEERQEQAKAIKEKLEKMGSLEGDAFAKNMYKELALEGFGLLQMTKSEMEIDPSPRYVEVIATLSNAVVSAADSYRDIDIKEKEFAIERQKIEAKRDGPASITQNIAFTGTLQDLMKQINVAGKSSPKTIEVKAEVRKE